jgi:D-sedoheptulose 7-phosphate isomerase
MTVRALPSEPPEFPAIMSTHFATVHHVLTEAEPDSVQRIGDIFREPRDHGSLVYIAANGGSSAIASDWVNDLGKAAKRSGPPLKIMWLADNKAWFSALSNDEGYDRAFAGQLENFTTAGDLLTRLSASGDSPNLVRAVELARKQKPTTVALALIDEAVWVRSEKHSSLSTTSIQ